MQCSGLILTNGAYTSNLRKIIYGLYKVVNGNSLQILDVATMFTFFPCMHTCVRALACVNWCSAQCTCTRFRFCARNAVDNVNKSPCHELDNSIMYDLNAIVVGFIFNLKKTIVSIKQSTNPYLCDHTLEFKAISKCVSAR